MPSSSKSRRAIQLDERRLILASDRLRLASEPKRLRVLLALTEGEMNVGELCEALEYDQTATSNLLSLLRVVGLVEDTRVGRRVYYNLTKLGWLAVNAAEAMAVS
jgi:DNA-binding transcriptional ArsR family regulator